MTFAFGSFTLGAALLFSAFKNQSLVSLILGKQGESLNTQHEASTASVAAAAAAGTVPGSQAVGNAFGKTFGNTKGYVNPFSSSATSGRIDQGKDVGGSGPIRAIGNGVVVSTGAPGWPGGEQGLVYQLTDGPAKGKYIYVYEGVSVKVRTGQRVKAGQVIGTIIPGTSTGIELGWSDRSGVPLSHGEYTEGKETVYGKDFASFLARLGFK